MAFQHCCLPTAEVLTGRCLKGLLYFQVGNIAASGSLLIQRFLNRRKQHSQPKLRLAMSEFQASQMRVKSLQLFYFCFKDLHQFHHHEACSVSIIVHTKFRPVFVFEQKRVLNVSWELNPDCSISC